MPTAREILDNLYQIANQNIPVAILWHAVFYLILAGLTGKWRPGRRIAILFGALPLLSVALMAWSADNLFNTFLPGGFAAWMVFLGWTSSDEPIVESPRPYALAGYALVGFGLVYPHFTHADSVFTYLFASPAGLIPCPTISVLIGFLLLYSGFGYRRVMLVAIAFGLFYGLIGVLWLGVWLDLVLIAGSLTAGGLLLQSQPRTETT